MRLVEVVVVGVVSSALLWSWFAVAAAPAAAFDSVDRFLALGTGSAGGQHDTPRGVAVSAGGAGAADAGDVYVADVGNQRVQVFDAGGVFKFAFGRDVVVDGTLGDLGVGFEKCLLAINCKRGSVGSAGGEFNSPNGVAINQDTGDVYVRERASGATGNFRVQQFDAAGNFVRAWGWGVLTGAAGFEICTVAEQCQAGLLGSGVGQFGAAALSAYTGIAVSPLDGDVFVVDPGNNSLRLNRIQRFDSDGSAPAAFGTATQFPNNNFPTHVAVDAAGVVYANNSTSSHSVVRYDSGSGAFLSSLNVAGLSATSGTAATSALAVDPATDNLLVGRTAAVGILEFDNPGGAATHVGTHAETLGLLAQGLAVIAPSRLYVSTSSGTAGNGVYVLDGDGTGTDIAASGVGGSNATATSIDLVGTVDPAEGLVRYRFQYSADGITYTNTPLIGHSGSGPGQVSYQLTGLDPNTLYRVRLQVEKVLAPTNVISETSSDALATTAAAPPQATTLGSTDRTDTAATLRGLVDPNGSATSYRFEYGPAGGAFDRRIPIPDAPAGNSNTASMVLQHVTGLLPDTSYHYRLVATNATGEDIGDAITFSTAPVPGPVSPVQPRGFELVSPADKVGGIGVGLWYVGASAVASSSGAGAYDGERFAVQGGTGSMLVNSAQGYGNDWAFAERVGDSVGWRSHAAITHAASNPEVARLVTMVSASDDLSTVVTRTGAPSPLAVFPELATWPESGFAPSYVVGWDGRWELFGPTSLSQVAPGLSGGQIDGILWETAVSRDGDWVVGSSNTVQSSDRATVGGMAGPGDPSDPARPDLVVGRSVYLADLSAGPSDEFEVSGARWNVGICSPGTVVPRRDDGSGKLGGQACPAPVGDSTDRLISDRGATLQALTPSIVDAGSSMDGVVSRDGSRVFFMSPDPTANGVPNGLSAFCSAADAATSCPTQLYVRQRNGDGSVSTRWVSRAEDGLFGDQDASLTGAVRFEGASADGSRVFFRTNSPLTTDDPNGGAQVPGGVVSGTASNQSWDLYMYELPDGPGADPGDGTLTRISGGPSGDSDCNVTAGDVDAGALRFVSDDGLRGYFTCAAWLGGVGVSGSGTIVEPGGTAATTDAANLYAYDHAGGGSWEFVSRLPRSATPGVAQSCATTGMAPQAPLGADGTTGTDDLGLYDIRPNCVRGTSDGEFVTFWTTGRLTGDDPDGGSADVYGYDLASDELTRLTAAQGGVGGSYPCGNVGPAAAIECFGDGGFDHSGDPTRRGPLPNLGVATDPLVAGDRVAFFQSRSRLVAEDVDDAYDVYEWRNGDLSLVSSGASDIDGAFYKGNDRTGRNVYFVTRDSLSWQDYDAVADIYTARVGGGIAQPTPPVVCPVLAGGCRGGGALAVAAVAATGAAGGGDAERAARARLTLGGLGARARRRAARSGVLAVRVRATAAGRVSVVARARVGGRRRVVGRAAAAVRGAEAVVVRVRLSRPARRRLARGGSLRVGLRVAQAGARKRSATVVLRRAGR